MVKLKIVKYKWDDMNFHGKILKFFCIFKHLHNKNMGENFTF